MLKVEGLTLKGECLTCNVRPFDARLMMLAIKIAATKCTKFTCVDFYYDRHGGYRNPPYGLREGMGVWSYPRYYSYRW